MALRIRRGTDIQRSGVILESGEIAWTTDARQLWVGDGLQQGGYPVVGANVAGYGLSYNGTTHRLEVAGLTADDIANGVNNKFFSTELAQDAAATLFTNPSASHSNIQFQYDDTLNVVNATVTLDGIGLTDIVNDTSPQLGGDLDLNGYDITGDGNINITGNITAYGLGGELNLNSNDITGTGNITLTGNLTNVGTTTIGSISTDGTLVMYNKLTSYAILNSIASADTAFLEMQVSRGTFASPTAVVAEDLMGGLIFRGHTGTSFQRATVIGARVNANPVGGGVPGEFVVINTDSTGTDTVAMSFDSQGILTAPRVSVGDGVAADPSIVFATDGGLDSGFFHPGDGIVCLSINAVEKVRVDSGGMRVDGFMKVKDVNGTLPSPPEAGMIVLDGTTFKGYNGLSWVNLN
jgi:hypothetical protein